MLDRLATSDWLHTRLGPRTMAKLAAVILFSSVCSTIYAQLKKGERRERGGGREGRGEGGEGRSGTDPLSKVCALHLGTQVNTHNPVYSHLTIVSGNAHTI